jgi:hypothetical protein
LAGFGISVVEPLGSATRETISKMDLREWKELAQDCPLAGFGFASVESSELYKQRRRVA